MDEEWAVINSLHSSQTSQQNEHTKRFRPSVELNFNRFESMPQFQLDDDSLSSLSYNGKELLEEEALDVMDEIDQVEDEIQEEQGNMNELEEEEERRVSETEEEEEEEEEEGNANETEEEEEEEEEGIMNKKKDEDMEAEEVNEEEGYEDTENSLIVKDDTKTEAVFCESLVPASDNELIIDLNVKDQTKKEENPIRLLDSKLMDDRSLSDGIHKPLSANDTSFLSSIIQHNKKYLLGQDRSSKTRESLVDKNTTWRNLNSISGPSVPYISDLPDLPQEQHATLGQKPSLYPYFNEPAKLLFSPITSRYAADQNHTTTNNEPPKMKDILIKKPVSLSTCHLHSFAAAPQPSSVLTTSRQPLTDIPPIKVLEEEEKPQVETPSAIIEKVSNCFRFTQENELMDTIIYRLKSMRPVQEWHQLTKLDLSDQHLTSVTNLNQVFPYLEHLQLSHNHLETLFDLPSTLIYLYACDNNLAEIDIYQLHRLQVLNIAYNHINTLEDMSALKALRVVDASHNSITSCKQFQNLPELTKLSLKANCIRRLVNFDSIIEGNQLEILDVSYNRIESLDSIENLTNLCYLNAEHNGMKYIQLNQPMKKLCKLQLSFNGLKSIDLSQFPGIRTLYLDDNIIHRIIGINCITQIDSFSIRDQGGSKIEYNLTYLRGSRKLYLSGSPFYNINRLIDFFSLEYLELCAAHIEQLPPDFGEHVPNLSTLYLSFNRLTNIIPLRKLKYLKRLVLIDNRLIHMNHTLDVLKNLKRLNYLDLRQNPMSTNIYPLIDLESNDKVSPYVASALDANWEVRDNEFCLTLASQWVERRSTYRSSFIHACPKLIELDHIKINQDERPTKIKKTKKWL